ncbi:lanthionine synthetase C family protein [Amycolatopsis aidingensis]|uniref:lanthionine synthetase C family protein n=1 Tax=Amycolatopsis aidingensis TaxID=2842453 RepID=UPI001E2C6FE9|nr:lanthionine synthetase C family protein [Amycolatopsis aidingensis]
MTAQSLADGPAGQALLALERDQDARDWLAAMVAEPVRAHPDEVSLFEGAPAVAFTLAATRMADTQDVLDGHVRWITRARLKAAHHRLAAGALADTREFDLISGLTGLGAYLLRRGGNHELLRDVLRYLVRLTHPHRGGLPGWWARSGPTGPGPGWHGGHGNPGMAHGIAGPLALLALAMLRGIVVSGQAAAIDRVGTWLDRWRCGTPPRVWWPEAITRAEHDRGEAFRPGPGRPSWCYGTPGITRALHLAGRALDDPARQHLAEEILALCVTDEAQLAQLADVSLCHGWAGLLHTAWRASHHSDRIATALPRLLHGLTDRLARRPPAGQGLLTGTAGALLAQHAARTNTPPVTRWDACLLLNDEGTR